MKYLVMFCGKNVFTGIDVCFGVMKCFSGLTLFLKLCDKFKLRKHPGFTSLVPSLFLAQN